MKDGHNWLTKILSCGNNFQFQNLFTTLICHTLWLILETWDIEGFALAKKIIITTFSAQSIDYVYRQCVENMEAMVQLYLMWNMTNSFQQHAKCSNMVEPILQNVTSFQIHHGQTLWLFASFIPCIFNEPPCEHQHGTSPPYSILLLLP